MAKDRLVGTVALFVLTASSVPAMFSPFLPGVFTIGTDEESDAEHAAHLRRWIRRGEVQGSALALAVGISASIISSDALPFIGAVVMSAYILSQYEFALHKGAYNGVGGSDNG